MMNYRWTSCIPVLEFLIQVCNVKTVLEFGVGDSSSFFFRENKLSCITIETDQEWFDIYDDLIPNMYFYSLEECSKVLELDKTYDLIFIDSDKYSRTSCINNSFFKTELVVIHDTNIVDGFYNWTNIKMPLEYKRVDFKKIIPWTSILTNNLEKHALIEVFCENYPEI